MSLDNTPLHLLLPPPPPPTHTHIQAVKEGTLHKLGGTGSSTSEMELADSLQELAALVANAEDTDSTKEEGALAGAVAAGKQQPRKAAVRRSPQEHRYAGKAPQMLRHSLEEDNAVEELAERCAREAIVEAAAAAAVAGLANASVIPTSTPKDAQAQSQHASPAHPTQDTLKGVGLEEESGEGFEGSEVRLCCGLDNAASATGVHDESIQGESTCCCTCMRGGNLVGIVIFAS